MGVPQLLSFIRKNVPNGTFPIEMKEEIRNYYSMSETPNPPSPIIVVDLMSLVVPFCHLDSAGVICGGRFNVISRCMNDFFGELKSLGAELEFFIDGSMRSVDPENWCRKKELQYYDIIKIFDAVDQGEELSTMANFDNLPFLYFYTLKRVAMQHGNFHWVTSDQETVAFATKSNALAMFSNQSDLLIHEGPWRFWYTANLDIKKLTTIEYDRAALINFLELQTSQMPLLATLAGNSKVDPESLRKFQTKLGRMSEKVANVAKFIRAHQNQSEDTILTHVLQFCCNRKEMMSRFKESLNSYQVKNIPFDQRINEAIESNLVFRNVPLYYQMWYSKNIESNSGVTDLRQHDLGEQMPQVKIFLMRRMGGIILYHRQTESSMVDCSEFHIMIKLRHDTAHALHHYRVEFPTHLEPPPLEELLSNDPVTCTELQDVKMQLLCWIVSDSLDYRRLEAIPKLLQTTVLTLYCLLDREMIKQFEADLILQIAYDVTSSSYEPQDVAYPQKLVSRPFRLAFVYQEVYIFVAKAFKLVGLNAVIDEDPPFDGVLFHNRYDAWSRQQPVVSIKNEWRLYDSITGGKKDEDGV